MRGTVLTSAALVAACQPAAFAGATTSAVAVMIMFGASNNSYPGRGETGPDLTDVPCFYNSYGRPADESSGGVFVNMPGANASFGGYSYTIAKALRAAGIPCIFIVLTNGSSFYNRWLSTHPEGSAILGILDTALSQLGALVPPGSILKFFGWRNQGTSDMQQNNLTYQQGWAAAAVSWENSVKARITAAGFDASTYERFAVMSYTGTAPGTTYFVPEIARQQLSFVGGTPDPDTSQIGPEHPRLVRTENAAGFGTDHTHGAPGPATIDGVTYPGGGYQWMGGLIAPPTIARYYGTDGL
jgi:hypothetical protein